jgi:hypothetical protein
MCISFNRGSCFYRNSTDGQARPSVNSIENALTAACAGITALKAIVSATKRWAERKNARRGCVT